MNDLIEKIEPLDLQEALSQRYLSYALSTIMGRALPDVRDGLKPVHRRIVHTMNLLRLKPNGSYAKCARIVGDVMGKFHPHGDQAIYDALVRLAQDFSQRYPLVQGQGNFGNIDGDNAAAMRYTEARMSEVMPLLLEGIDENAIDFRFNYNEEEQEPIVLPSNFPNLLANGSAGIAVGMATNIPPHNVEELCNAALHLIKKRGARIETLCEYISGPDFPTGGIIVDNREEIIAAYKTGRGSFRVRAKWHKEELKRGMWQIVISEIPYQVQKSKLIEKTAELLLARKLTQIVDIRDESAEEIRIVLEPKHKNIDAEMVMEQLFHRTDFEVRFAMNLNVLSGGKIPQVLNLRDCLLEWLDHRREVLIRRTKHRVEQITKRLDILAGYLIVYASLDEVIKIIRFADNPKQKLIQKYKLNEVQVEAILNIRLRALHKLEELEIKKEYKELEKEKKGLSALLKSEGEQWQTIAAQIGEVKNQFSKKTETGARRTQFAEAAEIDLTSLEQELVEKEDITIIISAKGWVRAMRGHVEEKDIAKLQFKDGDKLKQVLPATNQDQLLLFATNGKFYTLAGDKLPSGRGYGEPLQLLVDMGSDNDLVSASIYAEDKKFLLASTSGYGFIAVAKDVIANTKKGKQVLNIKSPVEAQVCREVEQDADSIATIGENGKMLIFALKDLPEMSKGKGVKLQSYKEGGLSDAIAFKGENGLTIKKAAPPTSPKKLLDYCGTRAQSGRKVPKGFPSSNKFPL